MFARDERGVTLVEYGVAVAVAVGVGVLGLAGLSSNINSSMDTAGDCMPTTTTAGAGTALCGGTTGDGG
ncbi:hypothetical protein [Ovoidimarina sediminis]|uniref:hypothetical protein n=1 Tax=Ovoidimarina sediminis TaxID=3079856 RepID=UPI0029306A14|nr:hypothetical protein [Rhodophyticola sp. MJ-SS7]